MLACTPSRRKNCDTLALAHLAAVGQLSTRLTPPPPAYADTLTGPRLTMLHEASGAHSSPQGVPHHSPE